MADWDWSAGDDPAVAGIRYCPRFRRPPTFP